VDVRIRSELRRDSAGHVPLLILLVIAILALLVVGLIKAPIVVAVGGGIFLGAMAATGVAVALHHRSRSQPVNGPVDARMLRRSLDDLVARARTRLPGPTLVKVQSIRRTVLEVLPRPAAGVGDIENLHILERTVLDYLPTALGSYYELSPAYAATEVIREGKTAQELLLEQVTLLDDTIREIAEDLNRHASDRLVAHGRFLEDRFAHRDHLLEPSLPADDRTPRPPGPPLAEAGDAETPEDGPQV
jgi:hypothetical protein